MLIVRWQTAAVAPILICFCLVCSSAFAQSPVPAKAACTAPEYHQFDFWAGDWDAYDFGNPKVVIARNRVDRILDGCVIREDYEQNDGMHGESFNIYDAQRKVWHQSWVTNRGVWLLLDGGMKSDEMVLNATDLEAGKEVLIRGTWKRVSDGVRETAVKSRDGGKTWTPWFDIVFRPHHAS